MKIAYNEEQKKYVPVPNLNEQVLNLVNGIVTRFKLYDGVNSSEIHFFEKNGNILTREERKERLPLKKVKHFDEDNCYIEVSHYIDDKGDFERVKLELYDAITHEFIGKNDFDRFPILQRAERDLDSEKESILNRNYPWRFYEKKLDYQNLNLNEKLTFWHAQVKRMERINSPISLPYKNKGLNVLECYYINGVFARFEDDLKQFVIELAKSFGIGEKVAIEVYESRHDVDGWNSVIARNNLKISD